MFNTVKTYKIICSKTVKTVGKKLLTNPNKSSNLKSQVGFIY